ncbi:hypothetical protein Tco_1468430 [Tanacetum coccineum]
MLLHSLPAILYLSSLMMSLKLTCINSGIRIQTYTFYRFKIDKKKRFKLTLEVFRSLSGKTSALEKLLLSHAQILWGMYHRKYVDYVELLWEDFTYQIDNKVYKKQEKMYYPRFTKVIIHHFLIQDKTLSWRNKIGMHTSKDDYLINTLRFVSRKEASQIYGAVLPDCVVPPKIDRKFKKASPSKKDSVPVQADEEPIQKGKQVQRSAKKFSTTPAAGIVIRETPVKTKSTRKEKVDVSRGKGIELLSEVALAEKAQLKEKPPSVEKIKHSVTSEGTGLKPGVLDVTKDDSTKSESESWGNNEDDSNDESDAASEHSDKENESDEDETQSDNEEGSDSEHDTKENDSNSEKEEDVKDDDEEEEELIHTPSQSDDENDDEIEGDKDKGMDFVKEAGLNEPVHADEEVQEGVDAEMTEAQQGNENVEITQEQVIEVAKVTTTDAPKETEVLATTSSQSSDLASKFLNFSDIPHTDAEIISPFDVPVQHEVPNTQTTILIPIPVSVITTIPHSLQTFTLPPLVSTPIPPPITKATNPLTTLPDFASILKFNERIIALEKEVVELKKDPLHTQVTTLVDENLDTRLGETREEFMKLLSESLMTRIKEQVKDQLPQILSKEVSNFTPPMIEEFIKESRDEVTLAKVSSQPYSTYEAASILTEFELKQGVEMKTKIETPLLDQIEGRKEGNLVKMLSPLKIQGLRKRSLQAPPKTLPNHNISLPANHRGRQIIPKDYFINKDLEYLKGGDLSRRYSTSVTETKAATYELKWIEDLVHELWSPMVVKYDQHAYLGTSYRGPKCKNFYRYASNLTSSKDVYSRRRIIVVTRLTIMKKYDYDHLEEIEVRRDDEQLYTFKEDHHGIIYVDQFKRKRLMHMDELHKFSDGTLSDVRTALHDIAAGIRMEYLPMRKWSNLDKKRARVMVTDIAQKKKNEVKRTKPGTRMERVQEIKAGGEFILSLN